MRVGVFFQEFEPYHSSKDPGEIVRGLREIAVDVELVTLDKPSLVGYAEIPIRLISESQARSIEFWRSSRYDIVIAYTWLRSTFLWIPRVLAAAGLPAIVKADTDGRLSYPLYPRWDTYDGGPIGFLPKIKIARRRIKNRLRMEKSLSELSEHLALTRGAVVETPQAFANIAFLLAAHGASHLLKRISIVPNPVSPSCLSVLAKVPQIVAVGNWEMKFGDYYVKNSVAMCSAVGSFLLARPDYSVVLIGKGDGLLKKLLSRFPDDVLSRISILGIVPHSRVLNILSESRILFMPSVSEGLSIAASEALSLGCSIVGSPLESLQYLSQGGKYGTLSANFEPSAYVGALFADSLRWDRCEYDPILTSSYWKGLLNRTRIAHDIMRICEKALSAEDMSELAP